MRDVHVLGVGMVPFRRYAPGSGEQLARDAAVTALTDAGVTFADLDGVMAGAAHPLSPRGVYVMKQLGLTGLAIEHTEHASATGLAAMHQAWRSVGSGDRDAVLVLAYDCPEREMSVQSLIEGEGNLPAPALFAMWAARRMHERGTTAEHLALVAAKNWNYARSNPFAARQAAEPVTVEQVLRSKLIAPPLTSMMCTPWGEGAAAAVVCSTEFANRHRTAGAATIVLRGSHVESETYEPGHLFRGALVGPPEMTRRAGQQIYAKTGVAPSDVDVVQVHDAFAIEELVYAELLGFCAEGDAEKLFTAGAFGPGSRAEHGLAEFSTGGGLIGGGHPGGPTGLAQVHETVRQLRSGATVGLCHMLGAGSVCITQIFERTDAPVAVA